MSIFRQSLLFLGVSIGLAGCQSPNKMSDHQLCTELLRWRDEGRGSYYEWMSNQVNRSYYSRRIAVLTDDLPDKASARKDLEELREKIRIGREWRTPPFQGILPFTVQAPVIDGVLNDPVWEKILTFQGEYPVNSTRKEKAETLWKLAWDRKYLYFAFFAPDKKIFNDRELPFQADSLELFIMPDPRLGAYMELVFSPENDLYAKRACFADSAIYPIQPYRPKELLFRSQKVTGGYCVEGRIGFIELPGYLLGNEPCKGQSITLMMLRTDLSETGEHLLSSPVPFLYDGHNTKCYMKLTLGE